MRKLITTFILIFSFFLSSQETLFTLVDNSKTGIDFSNDLVDTKEHSIFLYANYYGGAGVGIAVVVVVIAFAIALALAIVY